MIIGNTNVKFGSAFGMSLLVKEDGLKVLGKLKEFNRTSNAGNQVVACFCPNCGEQIYGITIYVKRLLSLKLGTLDDTGWLNPTAMLWLWSAKKWSQVPDGVEKIKEQ